VKNLIEQRRKLREKFRREALIRPAGVVVASLDEAFLLKVKETVEKNIGKEHYSVEQLAVEVGVSYTQLHRKLRALTNMSTGQFVRWFRLQRAMELLTKKAGTISEIAYSVGFGSPAYFTKCFKEEFGILPSEATGREGT
jgi:AraC-like DNA-binding protein